jgi:hypothetical protein
VTNTPAPSVREMDPRELVRGLMRGNRAELKLGYSPANAVLAVKGLHPGVDDDEMRGYSQGFSDGMLRRQPMVTDADPDVPENVAYRQGYAAGNEEPASLTYPSARTDRGANAAIVNDPAQPWTPARLASAVTAALYAQFLEVHEVVVQSEITLMSQGHTETYLVLGGEDGDDLILQRKTDGARFGVDLYADVAALASEAGE